MNSFYLHDDNHYIEHIQALLNSFSYVYIHMLTKIDKNYTLSEISLENELMHKIITAEVICSSMEEGI
ncbi:MAG: hypothetical protein APF77_01210 [Clostridia bacterium BRH_c25]|nr:MAG: hypothetical protein APF77_01210 [Clostridia bacterium BRH_c25]